MKRQSTSLVTRKPQIKTTVRCHFTPPRMAAIQRQVMTSVGKNVDKLEIKMKMVQPLWQTVWLYLSRL